MGLSVVLLLEDPGNLLTASVKSTEGFGSEDPSNVMSGIIRRINKNWSPSPIPAELLSIKELIGEAGFVLPSSRPKSWLYTELGRLSRIIRSGFRET